MVHPAASALRDPGFEGRRNQSLLLGVAILCALYLTEFQPWLLWDDASLRASKQFLASFFPPAHSREFLHLLLVSTWQTVAVATAGVTLGLAGAIPLALIANRTLSVSRIGTGQMGAFAACIRSGCRWLLIVLRSVPELVWGLVFVRAVGLGDTAGVMAIALTYCGMMGKVFLEIFESQDARYSHALLVNGAGRLRAFAYSTLPTCLPEMVSYTIFRWECAIRSSVILGFVGAGGLGQQMDLSMKMLAGGEVSSMLLAFMLLVYIADAISKWLRTWMD